jgi:hypothetical protein
MFAIALELCAQSVSTYSVWTHVESAGASGKKVEMDVFHGRRANGDTVETTTGQRRRMSSPSHGIEVDIDDALKITTIWGRGEGEPPFNQGDCRHAEDHDKPLRPEDTKVILGFTVVREASASTLARDERWRAPELDCQDLERTTHFFEDGRPDGYTLYTATKALATAPDESLFAIPEGALEMPASRYLSFIGRSPARAHDQKVLAMDDAVYARQQEQRQAAGVTLDVFKRIGP